VRVLLCCWGSLGDLYPYLGIAERLAADGHHPVLATCPIYRPWVERLGVDFLDVPPDVDPADRDLMRRFMDPMRGSEAVVEYVAPAVRAAYEQLLPVARTADLIVSHPMTFAAPMAAEVLEKRWISTVLSPASFFSIYEFPVPAMAPRLANVARLGPIAGWVMRKIARTASFTWMGPVRALRADLGLPDRGEPLFEGQFSPYGTLALYSSVLGDPQPDWPPYTRITGFVSRREDAVLPAGLEAFLDAGAPPIVFTLGSSAVGAAGSFYEQAIDAATRLDRRAVLLTGLYRQNRLPPALPPGVFALDYAPHALLFPRAAATVHHGGIGTVGEGLRAGRPMLVMPFAHDQPDNAARVERLGVARVLPRRESSADTLAGELDALLDDEEYRRRAEEVGQIVGGEDGVSVACEVLSADLDRRPAR
jgi:UDP:flavonoid glycosyltransferase YjiC (YdhE family)